MKKLTLMTLALFCSALLLLCQELSQTVRGKVVDADSKIPLYGVNVILQNGITKGTATNAHGQFRIDNIPVGRVYIVFSYLGYEPKTVSNLVVNSGKELVLEVELEESLLKLDEVVVKATKNKGEAVNDMALLSARSISLEETARYTGGMNDPSRVVTSFAGVTNTQDGSSDIIVRGNSPKYLQWRLDGMEITSPYHLDDQNASYGALTAINNDLLATSDFYTGAFSPEYGNVLSSVFDIKLRPGNNEKFEATAGIGILGTNLTLEGPFKKGYSGSYLVNYRYSTISLIQDIGLVNVDGIVKFQDATFKLVLPSKKIGTFSIMGLGGLSGVDLKDQKPGQITVPGSVPNANISKDFFKAAFLANVGLTHTLSVNQNSYFKTSLSYSANGISDEIFESEITNVYNTMGELTDETLTNRIESLNSKAETSNYRAGISYNSKLGPKHKLKLGTRFAISGYDYDQDEYSYIDQALVKISQFDEKGLTINNFISWKYRINNKLTFVSGLHQMNVMLNNKSTLEPRVAVNMKLNNSTSIHAGYGKHSIMEKIQHYYTLINNTEVNKDLDLIKSDHYIIGLEKRFTPQLMAKVEAYYQYMYDIPIENDENSVYATINEGIYYRYADLVNKGTGENYGVEITLERFFSKGFYYMANVTLYNSTYKALDGIKRNTLYNGNHTMNILCGKEFEHLGKKQNKTLALNTKIFYGGGRKYIPFLRDESGIVLLDKYEKPLLDNDRAYENGLDDVFQLNFSISYKINKPSATHEIFLDLMNLSGNDARTSQYYDPNEPNEVGYVGQTFFFPNIMYRVYF